MTQTPGAPKSPSFRRPAGRRRLQPGDTTRIRWVTEPVPQFSDVLRYSSGRLLQVIDVRGRKTLVCILMTLADLSKQPEDTRVWDAHWVRSGRAPA